MKRNNIKSQERKGASHSQKAIQSSEKKRKSIKTSHTQGDKINDNIEDILMDISLKKPKNAYNFYIAEMMDKHKMDSLVAATKAYSAKWAKISSSERKKYEDLAEEDKKRYAQHLEIVKKNILQKPQKENATSYRLFLDENVRIAIENDDDVKEAKIIAAENWKNMDKDQKSEWEEKKKDHLAFYESLKQSKQPANAYSLFTRDKFSEAREKNVSTNLKEIAEKWNKAKEGVKSKYAEYAEEEKEEKAKKRDLYEIAFNVKPRRPLGALKFFLMHMAKLDKLKGNPFVEGHKLWKKLSDSEKIKYERLAQRDKLAYLVKKIEYDAEVKKTSTYKAKSPFNIFCSDFKGKIVDGKYEGKEVVKGGFFDFAYKKWNKLDEATKRKYAKKSDEDKVEAKKMKEEFKARVYDMPKRPGNHYTIYIKTAIPELKAKHSKKDIKEIMQMAAERWKNMSDKQKEKYVKMYDDVNVAYKFNVQAFEKDGYYNPNSVADKDESEDEEEKMTRKKPEKKKSSVTRSPSTTKRGKKSIKD